MSLSKSQQTAFQVPATYWKIVSKNEDLTGGSLVITLAGYISEAVRRAGGQPLTTITVILKDEDYVADMTRPMIYTKLKEVMPGWTDAQDC